MCLRNFLYKKIFLFHTCKSSAHCHLPALPRLWATLSHWHSKTHILVVHPQKDLFPSTISWQAIHYLVSSTSLIPKLSLWTHSYPLSHHGTEHAILALHFCPPIFFPFSQWADKHVVYLFIYLFSHLLAGSRCSQPPQQQSVCPLTDSKAGGCQID